MTLSHDDHLRNLQTFVQDCNNHFCEKKMDLEWCIFKKGCDQYTTLKYFSDADNLWFHVSITYDHSYSVPKLWFNAYQPGTIQTRTPIESIIRLPEFASQCSEDEHPFLGVAFYYVDPCRILQVTRNVFAPTENKYYHRWFTTAVQMTKLTRNVVIYPDASSFLDGDQTNPVSQSPPS